MIWAGFAIFCLAVILWLAFEARAAFRQGEREYAQRLQELAAECDARAGNVQ